MRNVPRLAASTDSSRKKRETAEIPEYFSPSAHWPQMSACLFAICCSPAGHWARHTGGLLPGAHQPVWENHSLPRLPADNGGARETRKAFPRPAKPRPTTVALGEPHQGQPAACQQGPRGKLVTALCRCCVYPPSDRFPDQRCTPAVDRFPASS